jgi:hypothetical protein
MKIIKLNNYIDERGLKGKMPEFDFTGNFLNEDNAKDGDICVIVGLSMPEQKENSLQKELNEKGELVNKKYWVLNIPIEINQKRKTYTPDNKTGLRFNQEWGADYSKWVGKKFKVKIEDYTSFGQVKKRIVGIPLKD